MSEWTELVFGVTVNKEDFYFVWMGSGSVHRKGDILLEMHRRT